MTFLAEPILLGSLEKLKISTFFKFNLGLGKILFFALLVKFKFKPKFLIIFFSKSDLLFSYLKSLKNLILNLNQFLES